MLKDFVSLLLLSSFLLHQVEAQSQISVGPLLTCDLTTFTCPGTSGCCTIGGCCGSGCCANGYTCINEGTSTEACCDSFDPTKCGTAAMPSSSPSTSECRPCTGIQNCLVDGQHWTCLLGKTCGFSYEVCNPCPYIGGCPSSSTSNPLESAAASTSSFENSPSTTQPSESTTTSSSTSGSSTTPITGSTNSLGNRVGDAELGLRWLVVVLALGGGLV